MTAADETLKKDGFDGANAEGLKACGISRFHSGSGIG
jgi:hypothetical protein